MNINIISVGKLKEKYWTDAVKEYSKRLSSYCKMTVIEVREERVPENPSHAEIENVINAEGKQILHAIKPGSYTIALAIKGKEMDSEELASVVDNLGISGKSSINFLIGGSYGLSEEVLANSDLKLSFSKMTFPHQLMRVILLEQIYRCFKINRNEVYHK